MRYIDADKLKAHYEYWGYSKYDMQEEKKLFDDIVDLQPTADVRDNATAHKVVGVGERDGATCWFECDKCGLAVDIGDVFCKHCGARFVP